MNHNFTVKCENCDEITNIRLGFSNRKKQPVHFACQSCGSSIDILLVLNNKKIQFKITITGADEVECQDFFDEKTNFVDIHLDFPASFEKYQMGMTPYIRAGQRIGYEEMEIHKHRLLYLDEMMAKKRKFNDTLKFYDKKNFKIFKKNIERKFKMKVETDYPQDINVALYSLIHIMMLAYEYPGQSSKITKKFTNLIYQIDSLHKEQLRSFVQDLIDKSFLENLQHKVLKIYPKMLDAELIIRPALFLDFDVEYAKNPIPMRVSVKKLNLTKTYTKIFLKSSLVSLYWWLESIIYLSVAMLTILHQRIMSLKHFMSMQRLHSGIKKDFIDDCWYQFLEESVNNKLRNAIAHNKVEYDEIKQIITYYPKIEGMKQNEGIKICFLEFAHNLLIAYREMHRLSHLIKSLFYYYYLIMNKPSK